MKRLAAALALLVGLFGATASAAPVTSQSSGPPQPLSPSLQQPPPSQPPPLSQPLQQPSVPTGKRTGPAPTFTPTQKIPANGAVSFPVDI